jgi:hypothetical protein
MSQRKAEPVYLKWPYAFSFLPDILRTPDIMNNFVYSNTFYFVSSKNIN